MQRTYKFRLCPNVEQSKKLQNNLDVCKWVYNKMIEYSKNKSVSRNDLNYFLTELKEQESWLYSYHSKMLQMISTKIDGALKALERLRKNGKKTGNLKFIKYGKCRTFTYNQSGFKIENSFLYLSRIGKTKIIQHRPISENAQIKQITVTKSKSGKWYCSITCDVDTAIPKISLAKSVGIDVGIKNFVYDSDGFVTPNPLNLKRLLKPIARVQRKIVRRQIGSQNRKKVVKFYQIIHERIKNRRKDFQHKLSTQYAKKYNVVFMEGLQKQNMVKNHKLARSIMDSSWGTFGKMLDYKCMLVEVQAKNTTANCSRCGNTVPKSLAIRTHRCGVCGLVLDRDHNASINILKKGLGIFGIMNYDSKLPQELREVTPVKILKGSMKQEAHIL
ncbi:MAG: RNA-guided endonuclease InsQ/TnpB family protein [Nitrososphaerales archaeon]